MQTIIWQRMGDNENNAVWCVPSMTFNALQYVIGDTQPNYPVPAIVKPEHFASRWIGLGMLDAAIKAARKRYAAK